MSQERDSPESRIPIASILKHYGLEIQDGLGWQSVKCPFHGDRDASASVSTALQLFVCHACEIKGRAQDVLVKVEGLSYADAVLRAEEISGASYAPVHGQRPPGSRLSRSSGNLTGGRKAKRPGSRRGAA